MYFFNCKTEMVIDYSSRESLSEVKRDLLFFPVKSQSFTKFNCTSPGLCNKIVGS
jgi:hypothetical protein